MWKKRLISKPLWIAILALIYLVCEYWFNFKIPGWTEISTQIIAILCILFGVVNNPTDRDNF